MRPEARDQLRCARREGSRLLAEVSGTAAKYGEPSTSVLRRDEIGQLLVEHGLVSVADFGADGAVARYFGDKHVDVLNVQRMGHGVRGRVTISNRDGGPGHREHAATFAYTHLWSSVAVLTVASKVGPRSRRGWVITM